MLESTKSLDLLLGIVVFRGWRDHYLSQGPMHLATVILLGQTLAAGLGLLKPIPHGPFGTLLGYSRQQNLTSATGLLESPGTMEERRAVIGLFYVTSMYVDFHSLSCCILGPKAEYHITFSEQQIIFTASNPCGGRHIWTSACKISTKQRSM